MNHNGRAEIKGFSNEINTFPVPSFCLLPFPVANFALCPGVRITVTSQTVVLSFTVQRSQALIV